MTTYGARSGTSQPNVQFTRFDRAEDESNLAWAQRAATDLKRVDPSKSCYLLLIGSCDTLGFRLRVAQSHLRPDMLPSYWSDALLVNLKQGPLSGASGFHVPLHQPESPSFPPYDNGVAEIALAAFDDPKRYPNIAVAVLPIPMAAMLEQIELFKRARLMLDSLDHVLRWLSFSWGVAGTGNPLHQGFGMPSACMIEMVCAARGYELTPGLESRASCPEAIWASLIFWHKYYESTGKKHVPRGRWTVNHTYPIASPSDVQPRD